MAYIRGLGKNNASVTLKELYKNYKSKSKNPVEYKVYAEFLKEYNERIMRSIIYDNLEYRFPYKLGTLRLQKRKYAPYTKNGKLVKKHISVDWKRTRAYWKELYPDMTLQEMKTIPNKKVLLQHNDHSDGYSVRFFWDKRISTTKNQFYYLFKATRTAKEDLAKFIKLNGSIDYFL